MKICFDCFNNFDDELDTCPYCSAPYSDEPIEPIHLRPGTVLNKRYFMGKVVGEGGFGIVYKAYDQKLKRIVAVKEFFVSRLMTRAVGEQNVIVFHSREQQDEFAYRKSRFLAEARTMAMFISNDNIPDVYEYFEGNGTAYIVMELLEGLTLSQYLKSKNRVMDVDFALMVTRQVGNALRSLHAQKILHLDVAPDNIFICSGKEIKIVLMDLGAAKIAGCEQEVIDKIMKPGYSPEELYNDLENIGPWSDIYALGATLYHMLTGAHPDESTNRKMEDTVRDVNDVNPAVPQNLSNIVMRSIALERHIRFQNVDSFLRALGGNKKIRAPKNEKKHRRFVRLMSAFAALVILALMTNYTYNYVRDKAVEEEAVLNDASISVWYCIEDGSNEEKAMEEVKKNFVSSFDNVRIELKGYARDEYLTQLRAAADAGRLPTLFESTDATEDIISRTKSVGEIYSSHHLDNTYFVKDGALTNTHKAALGIEAPVACVITNGNTCIDYSMDYFSSLSDFGSGTAIAVAADYEGLVSKNFPDNSFVDESTFFNENNTTAVLITSTRDINRIINALPMVTKKFVFYDADKIFCNYTYQWSLGAGDEDQTTAAKRLLEWMFEEVDQNYLMISYNNEGQLPVSQTCFSNKINENDYLKPIEKIYSKFVFD